MKKAIITSLISLIIVVVGPDLYADGTKGKKDKATAREKSEMVIKKISTAIDNELSLEQWMTEFTSFSAKKEMIDDNLVLETWMTNVEYFEIESSWIEQEMMLENWMTEVFELSFNDSDLEMESWMLQPFVNEENFQDKELVLESWMCRF